MFTLSEIIDLAIRVENNGEAAYRKAQNETTDLSLVSMFQWLADEEKEHEKWFTQLKKQVPQNVEDQRLEEMGREILGSVLGDQTFSIEDADFSRMKDINSLLEVSIEFERDTILFYEMLGAFIEDEEILDQLQNIISEEKRHIKTLEEFQQTGEVLLVT